MSLSQCKSKTKSGKKCKNTAIDKTGFCRSHYPDSSKRPSKGTGFEFKVLKVLRLLGYKVEQNCLIKGCQVGCVWGIQNRNHNAKVNGRV
jgi:hypothetical protein